MRPEENGVHAMAEQKALQFTRQKMKANKILKKSDSLCCKAANMLCQDNLFL